MIVKLPYGKRSMKLEFPGNKNIEVLRSRKVKSVENPEVYMRDKLRNYMRRNKNFFLKYCNKDTCILISDKTRYVPNRTLIPVLLRELLKFNFKKEKITLLVANGLHEPMSHSDLIENLGEYVVDNFNILNHDAKNDDMLVFIGKSARGTPLFVNKIFLSADLKIATGVIAPHFHAGFGGGCKSVLPGVSGKITILRNHSFDMVAHEKARHGVTDGNPIYEDIVEAGVKSGLHLIVNTSMDSMKNLTHVFIGEPIKTHKKAIEIVSKDIKVDFSDFFDIVITSNGGYPLDRNLYQAVKGVAVAELMVRRGGTIILVSECRDGVGHKVFQEFMSYGKNSQDILNRIKREEPVEDQDNIQILARVLTKAKIIVVSSGVKASVLEEMKMISAKSVEEALEICGWDLSKNLKVGIIPAGPYILPVKKSLRM